MDFKRILGAKSYFETEEERKFELIKLPLLKLVLERLPFLGATTVQQDDAWEQIAIIIQEEFPQENLTYGGFHLKDKYEQLYKQFYKKYTFIFDERQPQGIGAHRIDSDAYFLVNLDIMEYYLYQIHKLKFYNIRFAAQVAREEFENRERERYLKDKTLVAFEKVTEEQPQHSNSIDNGLQLSVLLKKIAYLEREVEKRDQSIGRLTDENKKLQELIQIKLSK